MDIQRIKELALANGFSLKPQASGNMDLNAYVYDFANAIEQEAKAQAVPEGFVLVPKEPTEAMIQRGTKANSECLNENAPLGERLFRHPALQVYQAMVNGSGE